MSICSSVLQNTVKIMKIINRSIVISITPLTQGVTNRPLPDFLLVTKKNYTLFFAQIQQKPDTRLQTTDTRHQNSDRGWQIYVCVY